MANEDYKNGKLVEIVREFNNTGNQYEINGIKQSIAVPFWRKENDKFQVIPKGSYSFINEAGNDYLKILDNTILQQATQFQIVYDYLQLSSKYIEDFPDLVILTQKYNQLVDDTSNLFSYLKSVGLIADTLQMTKVFPALEPLTTWYMDEKGEIRTLPVSDLYGKFQQMIDTLYAEIKKMLVKDKESMSTELSKETTKLLNTLENLGSSLSTDISKLTADEIEKIITEGKKQIELVTNAGSGLASRVETLEKDKFDKGIVSVDYNTAEKIETKIKEKLEKGNVSTEYDTAKKIEDKIENLIKTKEPSITKKTAFNKDFGTSEDEVLEGAKLAETLGIPYGGSLNNSNTKTEGTAYYDSTTKKTYKCIVTNTLNYADASKYEAISNNDLLLKFQNYSSKVKILWSGSQSTGTITLNESVENYDMVAVYFATGTKFIRPNVHFKIIGFSEPMTDFMRATLAIEYYFSNDKFNITYNELGQKFRYIVGIKF